MQHHHTDSSEVTVEVKDAKVVLEGMVPDRRMKHAIEDLADGCLGVKDVGSRIRVSAPPHSSSRRAGGIDALTLSRHLRARLPLSGLDRPSSRSGSGEIDEEPTPWTHRFA